MILVKLNKKSADPGPGGGWTPRRQPRISRLRGRSSQAKRLGPRGNRGGDPARRPATSAAKSPDSGKPDFLAMGHPDSGKPDSRQARFRKPDPGPDRSASLIPASPKPDSALPSGRP